MTPSQNRQMPTSSSLRSSIPIILNGIFGDWPRAWREDFDYSFALYTLSITHFTTSRQELFLHTFYIQLTYHVKTFSHPHGAEYIVRKDAKHLCRLLALYTSIVLLQCVAVTYIAVTYIVIVVVMVITSNVIVITIAMTMLQQ